MSLLGRCLGKHAPKIDPRTLRLSSYLRTIPAPPPARDFDAKLPSQTELYDNDRVGDCAIASAAMMIQTWTSQQGARSQPSTRDVLAAYSAVSGYVPSQPDTDRGCDMLAVLKYWRTTGIAGHRIRAFVKLDHDDLEQIQTAINLFGSVYCGASLPLSAREEGTWDRQAGDGDDAVGSWGGHAMACSTFDHYGVHFRTWGARQRASWQWWSDFVDEAYVVLSDDWFARGLSPNGFDLAALDSDLEALT